MTINQRPASPRILGHVSQSPELLGTCSSRRSRTRGRGKERERERLPQWNERPPSPLPLSLPLSLLQHSQGTGCARSPAHHCAAEFLKVGVKQLSISLSLSLSPPMCESTPAAGSSGSRFTLKTCCLPLVGREYQTLNTQRKAILPHRQSQRKAGNPTWFPDL